MERQSTTTGTTPPESLSPPCLEAPPAGQGKRGTMPIGVLLELARKRAGYSEAGACGALRITERELARYESGVRTPSESLLEEFSELYDADFSGERPATDGQLRLGWADIDVADCADNECRLARIAATLRAIRRVDNEVPLVIRVEEMPVLATALDLDDPDLTERIERWLALAGPAAGALAADLRRLAE